MGILNVTLTIDIPIIYNIIPGEDPITHLAPENCHPGSPEEIEWLIPDYINLYDIVYKKETDVIKQIKEFLSNSEVDLKISKLGDSITS